MTRFDLTGVVAACQKPECRASGRLHRHHKRHQALFVRHFAGRKGGRYRRFVERYYRFDPNDVVCICPEHHQEIHDLYRRIIRRHANKIGKPLWQWSWKQANVLMDALELRCEQWLQIPTPGAPWRPHDQESY